MRLGIDMEGLQHRHAAGGSAKPDAPDQMPFRVIPMLATLVSKPFDRPGWVFEEKYDGDRILAYKEGNHVQLLSRNDKDRTDRFPRIVAALAGLPSKALLLDGEVVIFDSKGVSRFELLQQGKAEPVYVIFDCLFRDGIDLRDSPLSVRRAALQSAIGSHDLLVPVASTRNERTGGLSHGATPRI